MCCNKEFDNKGNDGGQDVGEVCFNLRLTPSCKKAEPCCPKPEPCCTTCTTCCPRCRR